MDPHRLAHIGERAFWRAVLEACPPEDQGKIALPMRPGNDFHRHCETAARMYMHEVGASADDVDHLSYGDPFAEAREEQLRSKE